VREFARAVVRALEVPETLLGFGDVPMRADESLMFSGNPTRLRALTAWEPSVALAEGIQRSLELETTRPARTANAERISVSRSEGVT